MSLTAFHVFFIAACLALGLGVGVWGVRDYSSTGERTSLYLAAGSFCGAVLLAVYGSWFLRKIRRMTTA